MNQKFIKSNDDETIELLRNLGFQQVNEQNGSVTFINDANLRFSKDLDQSKLHFTNILTF